MALSFRSTTAYERYNEGRKYWALLTLHSRQLAHIIWIHAKEREGEDEKDDLLEKMSALNLIMAFALAVKHKLRHEIEYDYTDLKPLIDPLTTFAKAARDKDSPAAEHNTEVNENKNWGEFLGISFLESNPRLVYKVAMREGRQHGNLPYEISGYLGQYLKTIMAQGTLESAIMHGQYVNALNNMMDAYGGCERVLHTPLPLAYSMDSVALGYCAVADETQTSPSPKSPGCTSLFFRSSCMRSSSGWRFPEPSLRRTSSSDSRQSAVRLKIRSALMSMILTWTATARLSNM